MREDGFYWVKIIGINRWEVVEFVSYDYGEDHSGQCIYAAGCDYEIALSGITKINETRIQ